MTVRTGLLCLLLCLAQGGCASRAVRCDGSLQPINVPATGAQRGHAPSTPPDRDEP